MSHQDRVRQFFAIIHPEGKIKKAGIIDRWLWSRGYQTPPSVIWPLWAIILELMLLCLILRPIILVLLVFLMPKHPQAGFLSEYWDALAFDANAIVFWTAIVGIICWGRTYLIPWKRWRQLWKELNQSDTRQGLPG